MRSTAATMPSKEDRPLRGALLKPLLVATALSSLLGCKKIPQCFPELEEGDVIVVDLDEQIGPPPDSAVGDWEPDACSENWGIEPGTALEITVEGFGGDGSCTSAWGSLEGAGDANLEPDRELPVAGGYLVSGSYILERDACVARVDVDIESDELPTSSWNGGGTPPGFVTFNFLPAGDDDDTCPESCLVRFAARSRLE